MTVPRGSGGKGGMESWAVVFLGVIALASLVQTVFLVALAVAGRRLARRVDEMHDRFERELRPSIDSLSRMSRNLAENHRTSANLAGPDGSTGPRRHLDKVEDATARRTVVARLALSCVGAVAASRTSRDVARARDQALRWPDLEGPLRTVLTSPRGPLPHLPPGHRRRAREAPRARP